MAQLKDTTITGGLSVSNTVNITGATQHNADVTLYSSSGDSPSLIFQRGTYADTLNDYKITDVGGYLKVKQQGNSSTSGFTQVAELTNQGTFTVSTPPATDTTPSVTAWISPTDSSVKISTDATIASGDKLVIRDSSDSNKMRSSSISFGSSTTTYLRNDGTWGTVSAGPTVLLLRLANSVYSLVTESSTTALTYNEIENYLKAGPVMIKPRTVSNQSGLISFPCAKTINIVGIDNDVSPVVMIRVDAAGDSTNDQVYAQYIQLTASNETTGMTGTKVITAGMTVAQLTTGTETDYRPVNAKVIHDYIASLDATNVAY